MTGQVPIEGSTHRNLTVILQLTYMFNPNQIPNLGQWFASAKLQPSHYESQHPYITTKFIPREKKFPIETRIFRQIASHMRVQ